MNRITVGNRELLTVSEHTGAGFAPLVSFGEWRIAVCNATEAERLTAVQRHLETDEAFILLAGAGAMLVADGENDVETAHWVRMEPMRVYNVRRNVWHAHMAEAGSSLLIVENADTGDANSVTCLLSETQRQRLLAEKP
ncbi:MAG TPA: hypothetical protein PLP25_00855 [Candidatus Limiplasma sp.]|nr:hypothetical protein [Candidatus Limiplasma sp.]HPS80393.1 hypothetical protein [Candidatus Limiplasma sp.]